MKRRKCDQCDQQATNHSIDIVNGQKIEKHLCDACAEAAGVIGKGEGHVPINELLTNFVKLHSGQAVREVASCDHCGMTFQEFQETRLLGCPHCYTTFETSLVPLLERAHEGGEHHVGKGPRREVDAEQRQEQLLRMRKRLGDAVESEDYELAAHLRDEISRLEVSG